VRHGIRQEKPNEEVDNKVVVHYLYVLHALSLELAKRSKDVLIEKSL